MSAAKENPCRKFQANIFNKSKCQNCFKPRESHLLNDEDLTQVIMGSQEENTFETLGGLAPGKKAKPIYGGWLLLAPDGTDFDNPVHRSRKWQRRFFILYEHGLLRYALDEMLEVEQAVDLQGQIWDWPWVCVKVEHMHIHML
ncbi:Myosin phosphatase Rho-interacting protein [Pteropus alecto]|uniref:Myosin phosphatase Rho-interacting protein n=1 Tax=Pteropus alecto TaxID=9402 RepID=L5KWI2_PTEAL|nr:Myosin phosphatase Rho-interacting protein [Pteropus alecto]